MIKLHLQGRPSIGRGVSVHPFEFLPPRRLQFRSHALPSRTQRIMDGISVSGEVGELVELTQSLRGCSEEREQEWNISRKELLELVEVGILTEDDIEEATAAVFNPNRCGFERKGEIWVEDILNLGAGKAYRDNEERFESLGGVILEGSSVSSIIIFEDAAVLQLAEGRNLSSKLVIDAMGNFSPTIRVNRKPDGVCLVVDACCRGFKDNSTSDIIYSSAEVKPVGDSQVQYFWEAFPVGSVPSDRTTCMFACFDPQPGCTKLEDLLEDFGI